MITTATTTEPLLFKESTTSNRVELPSGTKVVVVDNGGASVMLKLHGRFSVASRQQINL